MQYFHILYLETKQKKNLNSINIQKEAICNLPMQLRGPAENGI